MIDGVAARKPRVPEAPAGPVRTSSTASLFDACGRGPAHFRFSLFEPEATANPKVQHLVESVTKQGVLLPLEASGGAHLGTFVTEVTF